MIITATIVVPASTTPAAVQTSLSSTLGTAAAASAALDIIVLSGPSITESPGLPDPSPPPPSSQKSPSPPPPSPTPPPPTGGDDNTETETALAEASGGGGPPIAGIGGGAAVAILLMVGLGFLYLRKKRMAGAQSSIALTAISLTTTKEKDLEGGAPATKAYSIELTKTPLGLGLSITDDVVTEIKPDSQAARDGKIKVGDRVVSVNGEAPTKAKPSSAILQATVAGTIVKLEFTSESKAVSAGTEMGQSSSVSAEPLKARTIKPLKVRIIKLVRTQPGETFGFGVVGKTTTMLAVSSVDAGGLAEAAGLQLDDCILTINGFKVADREQMSELLSSLAPGEVCTIKVTRVHPFGRSQSSSVSVDPSVSASPSKAQTAPGAELTRDLQKMRRAAELLESWKLEPSELVHGDKVGSGGQADVYVGRWQVSSRTSAHLPTGGSLGP